MRAVTLTLALLLAPAVTLAGAWGAGPFDNDDASDWLDDFGASPGPGELLQALTVAPKGYIQAPECSVVVAAAEVVASSRGKPHPELSSQLAKWATKSSASLAPLLGRAVQAVRLCRDSRDSELRQLWAESKEFGVWVATLTDLEKRLR